WCDSDRGIFLIADGLGGHQAGEIAAAMAVEIASADVTIAVDRGLQNVELAEAIQEAFQAASEEIYRRSQEAKDLNGMACSLLAAVLEPDNCLVAHAGDTRAYLLMENSFSQVTVDDTPVAALVKRGYLLPEKARSHSMKNFLVKSIGNKSTVEANISRFPIKEDERLLFCSDGLWSMVDAHAMEKILRSHKDVDAACKELVQAARDHGGRDNITVIVVHVGPKKDVLKALDETAEMPNSKTREV
ncbi:MAG TPA: protein phosphatase 2C domain-containing protein, partial [Acidobacteriota bacterium]|nr:protein phosphatase 2C domain-containing protein [Acidobacteriota bacterium]